MSHSEEELSSSRSSHCSGRPPSEWTEADYKNAETTHSELQRKKLNIERSIARLAEDINASRPINRMPVELLVKIFRALDDHTFPIHMRSLHHMDGKVRFDVPWYSLMTVCRRWHTVINSTPALWRYVEVDANVQDEQLHLLLSQLLLSRSGKTSIDVDLDGCNNTFFMAENKQHHVRITSLLIHNIPRSRAPIVEQFVHSGMPAVRKLSIWFDDLRDEEERDPLALNFSSLLFPQLQELSLCCVGIPEKIPTPLPLGLTCLEICDSINPPCRMVEVVALLGNLSHLEHLTLVRFRPRQDGFTVFSDWASSEWHERVALSPKLQTFVLQDIDAYAARFLCALSIPASADVTHVKLIAPHDPHEMRDIGDLVNEPLYKSLPYDTTGLPILRAKFHCIHLVRSLPSSYIVAQGSERTLQLAAQALDGIVHLNPSPTEDLLTLFAGSTDNLTELWIDGVGSDIEDGRHDWESVFRTFAHIRKLVLFMRTEPLDFHFVSPLLEDLEPMLESSVDAADTTFLPCPDLEEVHVRSPTRQNDNMVLDALSGLFSRRREVGSRLKLLHIELGREGEDGDPGAVWMERLKNARVADVVEHSYGWELERQNLNAIINLQAKMGEFP